MTETVLRNATMEEMLATLQRDHARKIDLVAPATALRFKAGQLQLSGIDPIIEDEGVTDPNGTYRPTAIFDEGVADRLGIPVGYLRKLRAQRIDLYDANVNGWIRGKSIQRAGGVVDVVAEPDTRKFLVRCFRGDDENEGVARALLSDRFGRMDNLDGLLALLAGIKQAGIDPTTLTWDRCDLSERKMYVRVQAPEIKALAPELLKGYRNPFADPEIGERRVNGRGVDEWRRIAAREGMGYTEEEGGEPVVFAGLVFANSEVGGGKWTLSPQIVIQICKNGLTFTEDGFGKVHLGGKLEEGVIDWSDDTREKQLALVTAQTRDSVAAFLNADYLTKKVEQLEEKAGKKVFKAADTVKVLAKQLSFTEEQADGILEFFILGGQHTAGGIAQAITAYSQTVPDADVAYDLDAKAVRALELAAA